MTTSLPEQLGGVRNWDYRYCSHLALILPALNLAAAEPADSSEAGR